MQTSIDISGNLYTELGSPVVKKEKMVYETYI